MRRYTPAFGALSFTALLLAGCKSGDKHEAPSSTPAANAPSAAPAGAQGESQVPSGVRDAKTQTLVNGFVDEAKAALSRGDAAAETRGDCHEAVSRYGKPRGLERCGTDP